MNRKPATPQQGPWIHRLLVYAFSLLFALLVYWLLGFVVRDIGTWPGPNYNELQRDAQRLVDARREPIQREYQARQSRHPWKLAALKLAVLVPLLAAAGWLFLRQRGGLYAPLIHGFGLAVLVKVGMVMQEHFPKRYFKYVLIGVAIVLVARVLVYLLRLRAYPKPDWLLKQYREAYEHFLCPACGTVLFEECPSCHAVRHALLPVCSKCGATRELGTHGRANPA